MRGVLLALLLLAPAAGAMEACAPETDACAWTENIYSGEGSCAQGTLYHEGHEAHARAADAASVTVYSSCTAHDNGESVVYRDFGVLVTPAGHQVSLVWWTQETEDGRACGVSGPPFVHDALRDACPPGDPPMLPALP